MPDALAYQNMIAVQHALFALIPVLGSSVPCIQESRPCQSSLVECSAACAVVLSIRMYHRALGVSVMLYYHRSHLDEIHGTTTKLTEPLRTPCYLRAVALR